MAKRKKRQQKPRTMADVLREACRESGLTHYRIGKDAGIGPEMVTRFIVGRDIRISTAGKIADVLGLELKPKQEE